MARDRAPFCTNAADLRDDADDKLPQSVRMNAPTNDDPLLDMIQSVTLDVLERIGDDREARFQFFKCFIELAKETVQRAEAGRH